MSEFTLHCFGQSGNCFKVAQMLQLTGADWTAKYVPFLDGVTRSPDWRGDMNEMGEAPVLDHGDLRLTQSGVILDYLADLTGKFGGETPAEKREIWRWILFDNHKFTNNFATLRFIVAIKKMPENAATEFLRGRVVDAYKVVEKHLKTRDFLLGDRPTIADLSLAGYCYYDEETGLDRWSMFPAIDAWRKRIQALPGWKGPYEIMPTSAS